MLRMIKIFFFILLSIAGTEFFLKLSDPLFHHIFFYDKNIGFRVKPFRLNSNSDGFNDREYSRKKNKDIKRIMALGDSFNWIGGYTNNYWTLAENFLNKKNSKVEIINQGAPGIGPSTLFRILKSISIQFDPDIVFLAFYVGNDFFESNLNIIRIPRFDFPFDINPSPHHFLEKVKNSYLYFVTHRIARLTSERILRTRGTFSKREFFRIEKNFMKTCQAQFYTSPDWHFTQNMFIELKNYLSSRNIKLYVVILPDESQINKPLRDDILNKYNALETDYSWSLPQKEIKSFLSGLGIESLDLLPYFQEQANKELYKFRDTHFNNEGNLLAATHVANFIQAHLK